MTADRPLRIALVAPPFLPLPPPGYAGTERIVAMRPVGGPAWHVAVYC